MSIGATLGVVALIVSLFSVPPAFAEEPTTETEVDSTLVEEGALGQDAFEKESSDVDQDASTPQARSSVSAPFAEGEGSLSLTISQQTGTEPFQDNDDPGNDSGVDNDIVRTNDSITYDLGIRYEGADQTSPTVEFSIPRGQELVSLPPFCLAGSAVSPESLPDPEVPLTATSWETLPQQEVTCILRDEAAGTSLNYKFITQVRSEVPNGTVMDEIDFQVTTDQVAEPAKIAPEPVTVSAAPQYDLSKRMDATAPNQGPYVQYAGTCPDGSERSCQILVYPVSISVPAGGKGAAPLVSPIKFEDNLDPASFFGTDLWEDMVTAAGNDADARAAYAPIFQGCSSLGATSAFRGSMPFSGIGAPAAANEVNSVRDSGTYSCPSGAPGENGAITISNTDTSAITVPSTTGSGNALPANSGYVVSFELYVAVPRDTVLEFGNSSNGAFTLPTHNEFTNVQMESVGGQHNVDDPDNNTRDLNIRLQLGGGFDKFFTGVWGQSGNTPAQQFSGFDYYEGPPGSSVSKDGNTVVMTGQSVQSVVETSEGAIGGSGTDLSNTYVTCDVWDADRLALAAHPDWQGYRAGLPSNGDPVYPAVYTQGSSNPDRSHLGSAESTFQNITVEYSSGPAGPGAESDCSDGTWSENPDDIVEPMLDDQGRTVWEGVNRVRISFHTEYPDGGAERGLLSFAIGQVVLDSDETTPIGNWGSQVFASGVLTPEEVFTDESRTNRVPSYNPETHNGSLGDRLIPGEAIVRVAKYVQNPTTGEYTNAAVPQYTAGETVSYRLNASLSTATPVDGNRATVFIEDCLPRYQIYESSEQGDTAISPELVQMGAPDGSELTCGSDRQYVRWSLGELPIGEPIEPIFVTAEILDVARNGVYTNDVLVSSPADPSEASLREDDVQMQLVVPTGIKISKTVDRPLIEVNPTEVTNPRTLTWSVQFANIDAPSNVANVDVIDVLPADGENGNDYQGSLAFNSATVAAGDDITILYTATPTSELSSVPSDASNGTSGATVWCDAISGAVVSGDGTAVDCPQNESEVTGLRFLRAGDFTPDHDFQVDIAMTPVGNHSGDEYRNITSGRVDGVSQGVGPAARTVQVIASQVGDRVWEDVNANGVQDDGEPGIPGFPVKLTGTDVDGNAVEVETVTDADGLYLFEELASGTYQVTFDPNFLDSNTSFTTRHAGSDGSVDSDADTTTGKTPEFELAQDVSDLTLDAGLVIDRNVDIVLDKRFIESTELTEDHKSTVTYELTATNHGTAEGPYKLDDELQFGGDIEIDAVSVEAIDPDDIEINPDFDGQSDTSIVSDGILPGGATHTFLVTVDVTIATEITVDEAVCSVTETESGVGFLNAAELTVDGVTVTDTGCGDITVPPEPAHPIPGLAITGGQLAWGAAIGALLLAVAGAALLIARRRNVHHEE